MVIASYISEVVLALEPWASRLKTPFITPGAASNEISKSVHADYEKNKYTFHGYLTSAALALSVCDAAKELLAEQKNMKTAVIMSEDAAWTKPLDIGYEECLPKAGLKVLDHIRFSPDTTDFTPIFNKIEGSKPDVIITGISHVGVQPTVQWKNQQVPIPMLGIASQATNETFGKDTNDASNGVLYQGVSGPGVPVTPKSIPFADGFKAKFGNYPSYAGYTAYDEVYFIADAIKRAGTTDADKLVDALEKTDWEGTIGRVQFYGKDDPFTHSIKYGQGLITGLMLQWQDGKQVSVWPKAVAKGTLKFQASSRSPPTDIRTIMLPGFPPGAFSYVQLSPEVRQRCCGHLDAWANLNACLSDPDRRFCHQRLVCAGRDRIHPDLRRLRRA